MAKPRRDPDYYSRVLIYADTRDKLRALAEHLQEDMIVLLRQLVAEAASAPVRGEASEPRANPRHVRVLMYASTRRQLRILAQRRGEHMTVVLADLVARAHRAHGPPAS